MKKVVFTFVFILSITPATLGHIAGVIIGGGCNSCSITEVEGVRLLELDCGPGNSFCAAIYFNTGGGVPQVVIGPGCACSFLTYMRSSGYTYEAYSDIYFNRVYAGHVMVYVYEDNQWTTISPPDQGLQTLDNISKVRVYDFVVDGKSLNYRSK